MMLNRAFEWSRAVAAVEALREQKIFRRLGAGEHEVAAACGHNPALHSVKFKVEDAAHSFLRERAEDYDFVEPVHKLRRELAPCRLDSDLFQPRVNLAGRHFGRRESQFAFSDLAHFARAEVGGHDDDAARKIYAAVIAERQGGFVEDAE